MIFKFEVHFIMIRKHLDAPQNLITSITAKTLKIPPNCNSQDDSLSFFPAIGYYIIK